MSSHISEPNGSSYVLQDDSGRQYVVSENTKGDDVQQTGDEPYPEMTKEHLLRHSGKPLWRYLRTISIIIIVLGWIALIAATIAIIVIHPRCKQTPSVSWWQKSVVYRVYIRSFKDSNEDGIGDLKGVTTRLQYLKDLGVSTISLSPFYKHEQTENEFSVLNHTQIDSTYGTMEDFQELVDGIHEHGMKLVVDFIPGTTSKQHMWFTESESSGDRTNTYRNYYVWDEGTVPPNNWLTVYSGSEGGTRRPAWTVNPIRNSPYLHQFLATQPSLNLRNSQVQLELENILRFWIDNGVDGFYIRNSAYLFVDYDLRDDELKTNPPGNDVNDYESYNHIHTFGLPEINDMFSRWRHLVNSHANSDNVSRFLIADIRGGTIQQTMSYYGRYGRDGVDISLNYDLLDVKADCNGACVKERMDSWLTNIPSDRWLTWMVGIEDTSRLQTTANSTSLARSLTLLTMTLPGTPVTYYGNEIGMSDIEHTPGSRWSMDQPMRSPMQWTNDTEGGFMNCTVSCGTSWIPVNSDYEEINVELQEKDSDSDLALFKTLTELRATPTMQYGLFQYVITNDNIVSFRREFDGLTNYLVVINFGQAMVTHNFSPSDDVTEGVVEAATNPGGTFKKGETINLNGITLNQWEGVVLSWDYQIKQY